MVAREENMATSMHPYPVDSPAEEEYVNTITRLLQKLGMKIKK